jgi:hypothetical protein
MAKFVRALRDFTDSDAAPAATDHGDASGAATVDGAADAPAGADFDAPLYGQVSRGEIGAPYRRRFVTAEAVRRYVGVESSNDKSCLAKRGMIHKTKHVKDQQKGDQLKMKTVYQYLSAAIALYGIESAINVADNTVDPIPLCTNTEQHKMLMKTLAKNLQKKATQSRAETHGAEIGVHGIRASTEFCTRGCHWFPRLFA